jgi:dUTP pyrophosphatase
MEIKYTSENANIKLEKDPGNAGFDLRSNVELVIEPGETKLVKTGLKIEFPSGTMGLVMSRSGLALKNSVFVLNAPGLCDESYRGDIGVILHNSGNFTFKVSVGDRVAQLVIMNTIDAVEELKLVLSETIDINTYRGEKGFGASGVK